MSCRVISRSITRPVSARKTSSATFRKSSQGKYATFVQTFVNLQKGTIVNIYDAENPEALAREFERIGFPFDEIQEIQFGATADDLRKMSGGAA